MKEILHLTLLGSPRVRLGDQLLTDFATNKAQALLFYLVVTGQPHSRDEVATLLWEEMSDAQAKKNLRTVLPDLRRLLGEHVQVERQTLAFDRTSPYWLDVEVLRSLEPGRAPRDLMARQAVVDLYGGEFLSGFYVHNAPAFDAWVLTQREQLHTLVANALTGLVDEYAQRAEVAAALAVNRRLLLLEPWSEPAHRQQMILLAQTGERAAALAQYETCRRVLAEEFGVEPVAATIALYEQIRAGGLGRQGDKKQERQGGNGRSANGHSANVASPQSGTLGQSSSVVPAPEGSPRDEETNLGRQANGEGPKPYPSSRLQVTGHNLPQRTKLYGRQEELARLQKWIREDGCYLVGIFGIGGQGKTTLAATLVRNLAEAMPSPNLPQDGGGTDSSTARSRPPPQPSATWEGDNSFTHIIWQSLLNAPPLAEVLQAWFYVLSDQTVTTLPTGLDQQLGQLVAYLRYQRCLLVLDNLESILQSDERSGYYRIGYEAYGQLIRCLAEGGHRSCLLLTSRERPQDLTYLEEDTPTVRFLALAGLPTDAGQQMLQARGLANDRSGLGALVQYYSGNPLALKLAAETVQEIFNGNTTAFLQAETLVFDDIRHVLDQQFARLTSLERELMLWLAIVREPIAYTAWRALLAQPSTARLMIEAVRSLQRRSLVEKYEEGFGLQNVVLEYTTALLIENIVRELLDDKVTRLPAAVVTQSHLNRHALILAQTKEYVRASQIRQLLQPVAEHLRTRLGSQGAERQLQKLLRHLRTMPAAPGYAAANLFHLLLQLGVDLRGYDFSRLYLRQAYLRGVSLPQTNFAETQMQEIAFTEPFGIVYAAVFSPDGQYVAAGTSEGAIYLWRTADQQLAHVIQAHRQAVKQVTFVQWTTAAGDSAAPPLRERHLVLASASDDKRLGFWSLTEQGSVYRHVHLAHAQQEALIAVGLRSGGQRVTGVDIAGHVFVWDVGEQQAVQLVHHFATAFTRFRLVGFSNDGQTVAIGHRDGIVRLWQAETGEARLLLAGKTGLIFALAVSRDGQMLVTGGRDGHLCLWTLPAGELHQVMGLRPHCVIETKAGAIHVLAFSPDSKFLASGHEDLAVRLWRIDAQGRLHLHYTLLGHTQSIWSVGFGPSPVTQAAPHLAPHEVDNRTETRQLLVTGSSDQTVRVWDVETGHLLYMLRGQPRVLAAHTLCPLPPTQRASHGSEPGWLLAAAGYDGLIHLWQGQGSQTDGAYRVLRGARGPLYAVAFSPDGRSVAGGGYDRTVYLWDSVSGQLRQTFHGHTNRIYTLAFHPAPAAGHPPGAQLLASGSGDGTVRLWALPEREWSPGREVEGSAQPVAVLQADLDVVHALTFSPDGRFLARGGTDRWLRLWDMTQRDCPELVEARQRVQDESEEDIFAVAFSPDGSKVACSGNHLIHIVDVARDKASRVLQQHTSWIYSVAFSPDGATLASSSADCTVCLWEVASGLLCAILRGHSETVYKVAFTPDGMAVVSSSFDGTIKFWDSQSGNCVNTLAVEGPYAQMNITGVTGVTEAQKAALKVLGAVEE